VVVVLLLLFPVLPQLVRQHKGPDHEQDAATLARIEQAVQDYRQNTRGYNPPSLHALVPNYLDRLPETSMNEPFIYDSATGRVRNPHPPEVAQEAEGQPGPGRARMGGSGGLVGETMTGVGIQQELR